jgi:hypothetical protein
MGAAEDLPLRLMTGGRDLKRGLAETSTGGMSEKEPSENTEIHQQVVIQGVTCMLVVG